MNKIMPIFSIIFRVLIGLILVTALVLNLGMAYIMFAPDSLPKPFYLFTTETTAETASAAQSESEGQVAEESSSSTASESDSSSTTTIQPGEGIMLNTGTKIINLTDTTKSRYIRVTIVMEFAPSNPDYKSLSEEESSAYLTSFTDELNTVAPLIDDTIITTLSTKSFEDLYTADGKETLRQELMQRVTEKLPSYKLIAIYFTEFVVE